MEKKIEQKNSPTSLGVGARLKAAREAADMSLGEVADRLKLSMRQLSAIESDDFKSLPGATFVRGFVRNYAKFLGLDPEPLMHALDQQFPSAVTEVANLVKHGEAPEPEKPAQPAKPARAKSGGGKWLALAAVLAAGGGAAWYFTQGGAQSDVPGGDLAPMLTEQHAASAAHAALPASEPVASAPVAAGKPATQASAPAVAAPPPMPASAPAAKAPAKAAKPAASAAQQQARPASSAASAPVGAGSDRVAVSVKEAAWVSIQDANGRKLVYATMQPGERKDVVGVAPFKVVVGNASQVDLSLNGKAVDFSDKIRGTTAKIELK
ncbi:XRE family transcriptional regulator [Xenophilus sp. AP218F]|nr:XRE family transcriptional regulator [Xenophilus sp. AP218F]